MRKLRVVRHGDAASDLPASALFAHLWSSLSDLLGTAAAATLLTRAARRAQPRSPELRELTFARVDGQFAYAVPASFHRVKGPPVALRELVVELRPLLAETTGPVALRHLEEVPELKGWTALAS